MKLPSKTWLLAVSGIALTVLSLFFLFRPSPLPVDAGRVNSGPLQVTVESEGMTRVVDRYTVAAPVSGRLLRSTLREGDPVHAGMILASIVAPELNSREFSEAAALAASARSSLNEAEARSRQVSVNLGQAKLRAGRFDNLYREGAVSKESWEQTRNEADVLEKERQAAVSAVAAASSQYEAARAKIDRRLASKPVEVTAPADGQVLRIYEKSERTVPAGTALFDIGDPGTLEIVIDVLSADAVSVRPGQAVKIDGWGGREVLRARVNRIEPAAFTKVSALGIEEKRVNIIALPERVEPGLGDNFRVQATIVVQEAPRVLRVPVSSLFRSGTGWRLFVIEGGRAVERKVRIGLRGVYEAEVLDGVKDGEPVVLHPQNELKSGMRVTVRGK
ncbi:MAG: efflux RND transporter periplasmic adaptor subunit [Chlorobiaceae bacterium]|nr:efflux RND transporter periplasmic adaptor subunit [Chlorobiaceae bacterium]